MIILLNFKHFLQAPRWKGSQGTSAGGDVPRVEQTEWVEARLKSIEEVRGIKPPPQPPLALPQIPVQRVYIADKQFLTSEGLRFRRGNRKPTPTSPTRLIADLSPVPTIRQLKVDGIKYFDTLHASKEVHLPTQSESIPEQVMVSEQTFEEPIFTAVQEDDFDDLAMVLLIEDERDLALSLL